MLKGGVICLWVWMTTLNSEEITLCSGSVLHRGGQSAFESKSKHWTVKISLCALTMLTRGGPPAFESEWQHWTVKRSLCALTVFWLGESTCLWVSMTTLNSEEDNSVFWAVLTAHRGWSICLWVWTDNIEHWRDQSVFWQCFAHRGVHLPLNLNDNIEQWRDHSVLWQCFEGGVHLPINLDDNIEQWRDHSVLWQCWLAGPSAFESEWQHWTVKRSPCALTVLTGGWSICLWVWMTTLNIGEINLCSSSVLHTGCRSTFEAQWKHWTVKRSLCALTVFWHIGWFQLPFFLNDNIEQWRDHSVL